MAYVNNTPQANQTISFTQPILQDNSNFLQTGLDKEHNFNASGTGTDMYHKQTSMTNQALLAAFPVSPGTVNGCYYVSGGVAYFYDGTKNYPLSPFCIRAAVNFDASGGIRSSFNVSSVTRTDLGCYTVTFTTAMPSVNYCVQVTGMRDSDDVGTAFVRGSGTYGNSVKVGSVRVGFGGSSSAFVDPKMGNVIVFGG